MKQNKTFYKTSNLSLSATIVCLGTPLKSVDKLIDGKFVFVFQDSISLKNIIENFWKRSLTVEPNSFWDSLRSLKNIIHDKKEQFKGDNYAIN